ncbi:hypothetical protein PYR71_02990 [Rhizobium sp. MC63]|nr:hypothetical protein [Rhizobium sp. MC63]MDF0695491.1 hypothetical protein [Rhizobium sp. MC63]
MPARRGHSWRKHTAPPSGSDDGRLRWQWLTIQLLESPAFTSLSANASRAFFRIIVEHTAHAALANGRLVVTHPQFVSYGVTGEYVADALDELDYKGLVKVRCGRAGSGVAHPNIFTLTFVGDHEGAPPTHDWRRCTAERCRRWSEIDRKLAADERGRVGRKKNRHFGIPKFAAPRERSGEGRGNDFNTATNFGIQQCDVDSGREFLPLDQATISWPPSFAQPCWCIRERDDV